MSFVDRLKKAWNVFSNGDTERMSTIELGNSYYKSRDILTGMNDRTIIASVYNKIALDCSQTDIRHCMIDENGRYVSTCKDYLNDLLSVQANKDQTGKEFIMDLVMSMLDEGVVAAVPIDTKTNPDDSQPGAFQILSMRVGKVIQFYPDHVKVRVFDDTVGVFKDIIVRKETTPIIENPFYEIMNSPSGTLARLKKKLALLDKADDSYDPSKLDMIIQLPYDVRSDLKHDQAEKRRKDLEEQLTGSKYGIGYIAATEKITQLSRPLENNLLKEVEYFTNQALSQLNMTSEILNGTASEAVMLNYTTRVIEPIMTRIVDQFKIKLLTQTARTQNHSIMYFKDPFKLIPISSIAQIADTFSRNGILSQNELRQIVGFKPSKDTQADELRNQNLYAENGQTFPSTIDVDGDGVPDVPYEQEQYPFENQNGESFEYDNTQY